MNSPSEQLLEGQQLIPLLAVSVALQLPLSSGVARVTVSNHVPFYHIYPNAVLGRVTSFAALSHPRLMGTAKTGRAGKEIGWPYTCRRVPGLRGLRCRSSR